MGLIFFSLPFQHCKHAVHSEPFNHITNIGNKPTNKQVHTFHNTLLDDIEMSERIAIISSGLFGFVA